MVEVAFSDTDSADVVKQYIDHYKPPFPVGIIDGEFFVKWAQLTKEMRPTVPIVFMIDRQGMIREQYMGADPMMEERYLNENLRAKIMQMLLPLPGAKKGAAPKNAPAAKKQAPAKNEPAAKK